MGSSRRLPLARRLLALAGIAGMTWLFFIDFCDWVYGCGCRSLWNGAAEHCNIHNAAPPHCPWCADSWTGPLVLGVVTLSQVALLLLPATLLPGNLSFGRRLIAAAIATPLIAGMFALGFGFGRGYWSF